jgi:oxygen-independent coproporphyrinogen-3 oxidase
MPIGNAFSPGTATLLEPALESRIPPGGLAGRQGPVDADMPPLLSSNGTPDLGLYVHVPFCARHCDFCAFYQEPPKRGDIERYLGGVVCELAGLCLGRRVDTVFWGGGTPGLLPPPDLERLGRAVLAAGNVAPSEWTVEMAPSMVRPERLAVLRDLGVTRISMGVQIL